MPAVLVTWLMVFLRASGVVLLLPEFAGRTPPVTLRVAMTALIATLVTGVIPPAAAGPDLLHFTFAMAGEVLLGLALGFVGRIVFGAVEFAGRLSSSEVGFSAAPGFGSPTTASEPLAGVMSAFAVVLFFLFGGHLAVIGAFARSFQLAPAGSPSISPAAAQQVVSATGRMIEVALRISAPFLAMNFLVTFAFAVMGRALPRMQVFVMSSSVRSVVGIALLATSGALVARHLGAEFDRLPLQLLELIGGR